MAAALTKNNVASFNGEADAWGTDHSYTELAELRNSSAQLMAKHGKRAACHPRHHFYAQPT